MNTEMRHWSDLCGWCYVRCWAYWYWTASSRASDLHVIL